MACKVILEEISNTRIKVYRSRSKGQRYTTFLFKNIYDNMFYYKSMIIIKPLKTDKIFRKYKFIENI